MYFKFNSYLLFFLFMTLTTTEAQVGSKIDLENVDVETKALPTIVLFGKEYTFRERNKFIKDLLIYVQWLNSSAWFARYFEYFGSNIRAFA